MPKTPSRIKTLNSTKNNISGKRNRSIARGGKSAWNKLDALLAYDLALWEEIQTQHPKARYLIGLDEVGRGSLIDSVVAGAVCWRLPELQSLLAMKKRRATTRQKDSPAGFLELPPFSPEGFAPDEDLVSLIRQLDDSKKLKAPIRAGLAKLIPQVAYVGLGQANKDEIERHNIHYASLLALHRAFQNLCLQLEAPLKPDDCFLIMDGRAIIPDLPVRYQRAIIKGDGLSAAIAGASVIAKHARDSYIMDTLAMQYPGYGWEKNMGYATPSHQEAIRTLGLTPLHRKNFRFVSQQMALDLALEV